MSAGRAFFDTNVLLYTHSRADLRKQARAVELFAEYARSGRILLSTQVIQEFYAAGSRKLSLPRSQLQQACAAPMDLPLIRIDPVHIREAMRGEDLYRISFWDVLILAAAENEDTQESCQDRGSNPHAGGAKYFRDVRIVIDRVPVPNVNT